MISDCPPISVHNHPNCKIQTILSIIFCSREKLCSLYVIFSRSEQFYPAPLGAYNFFPLLVRSLILSSRGCFSSGVRSHGCWIFDSDEERIMGRLWILRHRPLRSLPLPKRKLRIMERRDAKVECTIITEGVCSVPAREPHSGQPETRGRDRGGRHKRANRRLEFRWERERGPHVHCTAAVRLVRWDYPGSCLCPYNFHRSPTLLRFRSRSSF